MDAWMDHVRVMTLRDRLVDQRAITSTSPSTPLTTLKGRSNTLPSFLAMARYSPSDSTTRGNAPIDSLMTSPPGVITDHAVFASASPPLSLTSFCLLYTSDADDDLLCED